MSYPVFAEMSSCSELKSRHSSLTTGSYVIDPDGEEGMAPFTVFCDMSDKAGVGVTVISHDSETRTLVNGCDPAGCYSRDVTYTGASKVSFLKHFIKFLSILPPFRKFPIHSFIPHKGFAMYVN